MKTTTNSNLKDSDTLKELNSIEISNVLHKESVNDLSNLTTKLTDMTATQYEELHSASSILHNFSTSIENLAINITNVQLKVYDTDDVSDSGTTSIKKLDSSLNKLQSAFTISNSTVNDLVGKLESVNTITDSISQIASQTNLLSLNAAIEAARAGEAGKGFSVVAGEVRKLAENSKLAVQSITKILDEIKKDILNASNAMTHGNDAIHVQQKTLLETKNSFDSIKTSIEDVKLEINDCIENLAMSSAQKEDVLKIVDNLHINSKEITQLSNDIKNELI